MAIATELLGLTEEEPDLADQPVQDFGDHSGLSPDEANVWLVRLTRQLKAKEIKMAKNKAMLAAFARTIDEENSFLAAGCERLANHLIQLMRVFHPDSKSLTTPAGILKLRARPLTDRLLYDKEINAAFERVMTSKAWDKMAVKAHIKETGEIPEGVSLDEAAPDYSLSLG